VKRSCVAAEGRAVTKADVEGFFRGSRGSEGREAHFSFLHSPPRAQPPHPSRTPTARRTDRMADAGRATGPASASLAVLAGLKGPGGHGAISALDAAYAELVAYATAVAPKPRSTSKKSEPVTAPLPAVPPAWTSTTASASLFLNAVLLAALSPGSVADAVRASAHKLLGEMMTPGSGSVARIASVGAAMAR
jgi:hypothetical protein